MEILEVMRARHSVRQYLDKPIEAEKRETLLGEIRRINQACGLHIQAFFDEPKCFDSLMAHYGKLTGVANYIALVGPKGEALEETVGYQGERLVLLAQELGLNTCWVALTHGRSAAVISPGEKQACLIALGYGATQGVPHRDRPIQEVCGDLAAQPDWFRRGMEAVMLAPTAVNQQKFFFSCQDGRVKAAAGRGFYARMDLGIVKYHFEAVTGIKVE